MPRTRDDLYRLFAIPRRAPIAAAPQAADYRATAITPVDEPELSPADRQYLARLAASLERAQRRCRERGEG